MNLKGKRVASDIIKELGIILLTEAKDEDIKNITITDARVTNDLSYAKVYFIVRDEASKEKVLKDLNEASSYLRTELAKRLDIRHVPKIKFQYDESIEYASKIEKLIDEINK